MDTSRNVLFVPLSNECFVFDVPVVASFVSGENTMSAHESVDEVSC